MCALVCRSWHIRAKLHLYRHLTIRGDCISKFCATLRNDHSLSPLSIRSIKVHRKKKPISALFTITGLENLDFLDVWDLDLTKEHTVIVRAPLSRSVTRLKLSRLSSCPISTLLRFLNSFHSLTDLHLNMLGETLLWKDDQNLPPAHAIPGRSLKGLCLDVIPNVDRLIWWYIQEGSFLASLERLGLNWRSRPPPAKGQYAEGLISLLAHCADTLEDLTIKVPFIRGPMTKDSEDPGMV